MGLVEGWYIKKAPVWFVQFDPSGPHKRDLPAGVRGNPHPNADNWNYEGCAFFCETLEGPLVVHPGDWIATGVNGEHWPVKDEIFQKSYTKADAAANEGGKSG